LAAGAAKQLVADAARLGYRPLEAESLEALGRLGEDCIDPREAIASLKRAVWAGETARHDETVVESSVIIAQLAADRTGDLPAARDWAQHAEALMARMGDGHPVLQAWVLAAQSFVLHHDGDSAGALGLQQRALALKQRALGKDSVDAARSLNGVAVLLNELGRAAEARAASEQSIAILEGVLGATHPTVGIALLNHGEILNGMRLPAEAAGFFQRAIDIFDRATSNALVRACAQTGLGQSLLAMGRTREARGALEAALPTHLATRTPYLSETRFTLARALWEAPADRPRALALARAAADDYRQSAADAPRLAAVTAWLSSRPPR
jgi:tetratricopeptide (TPR) repeat protein